MGAPPNSAGQARASEGQTAHHRAAYCAGELEASWQATTKKQAGKREKVLTQATKCDII